MSDKKIEAAVRIKDSISVIEHYLTSDKKYRDSDSLLLARIWNDQLIKMNLMPKHITAYDMLVLLAEDKLMKPYVVERDRRKLQEKNPELRGEKWEERRKQAKGVRSKIKTDI